MKKCLFFFMFLYIGQSIAQNPFYDANYLFDKMDATGKIVLTNDIQQLLAKYFPEMQFFNINELRVNENPFLENLFIDRGEDEIGSELPDKFKTFSHSGIGGLNVTKLVNALADIMIERAKQELTIAFFDRFKKFANDNPEFQILFPKTTSNLNQLLVYQYPQMIPALRNGFFQDLQQITYRIDDVLELPRYTELLLNYPEVRVCLRSLRLIHDLENNTNVADILLSFSNFKEWKEEGGAHFRNMGSTIRFAALFSESLRNIHDTAIWVSHDEIKRVAFNDTLTRLYVGLLYQQVKMEDLQIYPDKEDLTKTSSLTSILARQKENMILFQNKVNEFIGLAANVEASFDNLKQTPETKGNTSEEIYTYINSSIDIMEYAWSIVKIFDEHLVADEYLDLARKSNSLFREIFNEQYTQAVNDAVDVLTTVHTLVQEHPSSVSLNNAETKTPLASLLSFTNKVKPYALFMANVVEARSEAEIKSALENVILPAGSSSIKKHTQNNLAIQSYLGAFAALADNETEGIWSDKFGVTAPIGISWTPSVWSWDRAGSLSLFAAMLDIGAVVDYKLKRESENIPDAPITVDKEYKIELGQIFSPGVYLVYGAGANLPLSLGIGAQYGPGLSRIDHQSMTIEKNPSWRYNVFLSVDLPLFNLVNKPKDRSIN